MNLKKKNSHLKKIEKIVFFISNLQLGGAEKQLVYLIKYLKNKYEITLVTISDSGKDFFKIENSNVRRIRLIRKKNYNFITKIFLFFYNLYKIRSIVTYIKPTAVISFLPVPSILTLISTLKIKTKKIVSLRNNPFEDYKNLSFFFKFLFQLIKNKFDTLVVQTYELKRDLIFLKRKKDIVVIENIFQNIEKVNVKKEKSFFKKKNYFLFVGKITRQKGLDILLDSYETYLRKTNQKKPYKLFILSNSKNIDYIYFQKIREKINKSKYKSNIKLFFDVRNLSIWYRYCKAYILCSRYEGYPNSLMEAMQNKCKIISYDCKYGPQEILKNYKNKFIIKNNSQIQLTNSLLNNKFLDKSYKEIDMKFINDNSLNKWISIISN